GTPVRGRLVVDDGARRAVAERGTSLLPVGLVEVDGSFDAGDAVELVGPDGSRFAIGVSRYQARELAGLAGRRGLAALDGAARDAALAAVAAALERRTHEVLAANAEDVAGAEGQTAAIVDRLRLDPGRVAGIAAAVLGIAKLPDPIGAVLRDFTLENGIRIRKLRVPLGVVLVVFEARPNVAVDAAALCVKSGNACILRG